MIAGVCGGIAEYFDIDPVIVRVIAVILLLPGGLPGFIPYIVLWIIVPENPEQVEKHDTSGTSKDTADSSASSSDVIDVEPKPKA